MATGNAEVIGARFQTRQEADAVRATIESWGYDPKEISYILDRAKCSSSFDEPGSHWRRATAQGIVGGAAFGGIAGEIATIGSVALVGPIGLAAGGVIGGVVGLLLGAGLDSDKAVACEAAVADGALVMVVQTHAGDSDRVRALLGTHIIAEEPDTYTT